MPVFTTTYQKYGTQKITVTIEATRSGGHLITRKIEIPTHPHNNREETYSFHLSLDGVPRWDSNDRIPPADTIKEFFIDQVPGFSAVWTAMLRENETSAFLADYRRARAGVQRSSEEMAELRANYEPGAVVIDVITGVRTQL